MGSLFSRWFFAKSMSMVLDIPLVAVNHMKAHILAHFIDEEGLINYFPFLALTISGGHTQIVKVNSFSIWKLLEKLLMMRLVKLLIKVLKF